MFTAAVLTMGNTWKWPNVLKRVRSKLSTAAVHAKERLSVAKKQTIDPPNNLDSSRTVLSSKSQSQKVTPWMNTIYILETFSQVSIWFFIFLLPTPCTQAPYPTPSIRCGTCWFLRAKVKLFLFYCLFFPKIWSLKMKWGSGFPVLLSAACSSPSLKVHQHPSGFA